MVSTMGQVANLLGLHSVQDLATAFVIVGIVAIIMMSSVRVRV